MSKNKRHRAPAAFRFDHDKVVNSPTKTTDSPGRSIHVTQESEFETLTITVNRSAKASPGGFRWAMLFWCALGSLTLLAIGVAVASLIADLFDHSQQLGWLGLALAIAATVSLLVIVVREIISLLQLAKVEKLRNRAAEITISDNRTGARALAQELLVLTRRMPQLARSRVQLEGHLKEIIDGSDMVRLAERELMTPLDQQARKLISVAATRVSIVTALSPRALIDILFVFGTALSLVRQIAFLYGVRPGTLGLGRLMRHAVTNLMMTGGLATSDSLFQQMLGHSVTAKVSARLGEGVLNGLLTARFGLAAIDVIRPLPFDALPRPTLRDLMSEVLSSFGDGEERQRSSEPNLAIMPANAPSGNTAPPTSAFRPQADIT